MTIEEFGKTIQAKYPQYSSYPAAEVGQRMLTKYPQYRSVISGSVQEAAPKADAFLAGHPILKGISDFVGTTGLAKGIAQGIFLKFTPEGKNLVNLVSQGQLKQQDVENIIGKAATTKEILGSAAQTALTALTAGSLPRAGTASFSLSKGLPVAETLAAKTGVTGKSLGALTLGAKVGEGAAYGYGYDVSGRLQDNKVDFKPGFGTAIGAAVPFITGLIGALTKRTAGVTSGAGKNVIQQALDNPDAVSEAASQYAKTPEAKQELVEKAKDGIFGFLKQRSDDFGGSMANMKATNPLYKQEIVNSFEQNINKFKGQIKNGVLAFGDTTLTQMDQNDLKKVWATISKWKDNTPQGFENLRQAIGNYMNDFSALKNSRASVVLGQFKKDLTKYISSNVKGYSEALGKYGSDSQVAKVVLKELNLSGQAKPSTQLNQILRLFKKDKNVLRSLESVLGKKGANDLMNEIAGAILSEWAPQGVVKNMFRLGAGAGLGAAGILAGNPSLLAGTGVAAAMSSPRIVGKAATLIGKGTESGLTGMIRKSAGNLAQ